MLELDDKSKIILKKLLVTKEMFLAAFWVGWTDSLQQCQCKISLPNFDSRTSFLLAARFHKISFLGQLVQNS